MSINALIPQSKLPNLGTTIFTQMSALAQQHNAINLSQGFPDFDGPAYLQARLASAHSLDEFLSRFHRWARELGLAGATIRLFPDRWRIGAPSGFTHLALSRQAFEPLRIQRLGHEHHYLGPLNGPELLVVLPEAKAIGSVAMSLMGRDGDLGVILFTSRDAHHYEQGQATHLLQEIALMLPELLERWIERV